MLKGRKTYFTFALFLIFIPFILFTASEGVTALPDNMVIFYDGKNGKDNGNSVTIHVDGKIVAAGTSENGTDTDVLVLRYNSDGTLDTTFGANGVVTYDAGNANDYGNSIAIQSDGKIVLAGTSEDVSKNEVLVLQYNGDGTLDDTFSRNGVFINNETSTRNAYGNSLAIQSDGDIFVAGTSDVFPEGNEDAIIIERYVETREIRLLGVEQGSGGGGGCFLATAAYGSFVDPHVKLLRSFRGRFLLTNKIGNAIVNLYYKHSPPVANLIAKYDILRAIVR